MNDNPIYRRIYIALQANHEPRNQLHVEEIFDQKKHQVIGVLPNNLKHLHNVLHRLIEDLRVAQAIDSTPEKVILKLERRKKVVQFLFNMLIAEKFEELNSSNCEYLIVENWQIATMLPNPSTAYEEPETMFGTKKVEWPYDNGL